MKFVKFAWIDDGDLKIFAWINFREWRDPKFLAWINPRKVYNIIIYIFLKKFKQYVQTLISSAIYTLIRINFGAD